MASWAGAPDTIAAHFWSISASIRISEYVPSCAIMRSSKSFSVSPVELAPLISSLLASLFAVAILVVISLSENVASCNSSLFSSLCSVLPADVAWSIKSFFVAKIASAI